VKNLIASNDFMKLYKLDDESLVLVTKETSQESDDDSEVFDIIIRFDCHSLDTRVGIHYFGEEKRDTKFEGMNYQQVSGIVENIRENVQRASTKPEHGG
jgi:hypothetical protein